MGGEADEEPMLCSAPSGYHDEGLPMLCTRQAGHSGDHHEETVGSWAPGSTSASAGVLAADGPILALSKLAEGYTVGELYRASREAPRPEMADALRSLALLRFVQGRES